MFYSTIVGTNSAGLHTGALDNFCIIGLAISMDFWYEYKVGGYSQ